MQQQVSSFKFYISLLKFFGQFDVNSVNAMKEEALKRKNNDLVNFEKSISEAAQHIVMEANQLFTEGATVEAWKQKAEELVRYYALISISI